jgi:hypothetical protein
LNTLDGTDWYVCFNYEEFNQKKMKSRITINVPMILKMREIIFFAGKLLYGPFQAIFCPESSKKQFRGQKSRGPLKVSREIAQKIICPQKQKIISQIFIISGTLVILCPIATRARICKPF